MFSTKTKVILSALTALVVVGLIWVLSSGSGKFGAASTLGVSGTPTTLSGGSVPSLFSALEASESFISDGTAYLLGIVSIGGTTAATSVQEQVSVGTCSTATSTQISVLNPFTATSTVTFSNIVATEGATSTDFLLGTSTTPSPTAAANGAVNATTSINNSLFGMSAIATSTQLAVTSGVTFAALSGDTLPSSGTYHTSQSAIIVGPSQYLVGFSTSTYGNQDAGRNGGIAASTLGLLKSCTYKFVWTK